MKKTTHALLVFLLITGYSYVAVAQEKKKETKSPKSATQKKKPAPSTDCCKEDATCPVQSPVSFYRTPHDTTTMDYYNFYFFSPETFLPKVEPGHTKLVYHYTEGEKATTLTLMNKTYRLNEIHMHNGNEHIIDDKRHDFEIHMVYGNTDAKPLDVVVVGIIGDYKDNSSSKSFVNQVCAAMKAGIDCKEHNPAEHCSETINVSSIIKTGVDSGQLKFQYFACYGSLTTGKFSEGVNWIVKQTPVIADKIGLEKEAYTKYFPGDRPVQPLNCRPVQQVLKPR